MHREHAVLNAPQQLERIITRQEGIARIIINPKARMVNFIYEFTEDIHFLRKLGVSPKIILVMIFDHQGYPTGLGLWQTGFNALRHEFQAALPS